MTKKFIIIFVLFFMMASSLFCYKNNRTNTSQTLELSDRVEASEIKEEPIVKELVFYIGSHKWYIDRQEQNDMEEYKKIKPIIRDNTILFPIGVVLRKFSEDVSWDPVGKTISATLNGESFNLSINEKKVSVGDEFFNLKDDIKVYGNQYYLSAEDTARILNLRFQVKNGVIAFVHQDNHLDEAINYYTDKYNEELSNIKDRTSIKSLKIPVLMYHLCLTEAPPDELKGMAVTVKEFDAQLAALKKAGYEGISFEQYYNYRLYGASLPEKPVIITFDDGYENNYTNAFPILKKHNMKATIFIVTSAVGQQGVQYPHMTWEQMKEMEDSGLVIIHNHGSYHAAMDQISRSNMRKVALGGYTSIEHHMGTRQIYVFAYPYLRYNAVTIEELKQAGIHMQVTNLGDWLREGTSMSDIKRIRISHGTSEQELLNSIK